MVMNHKLKSLLAAAALAAAALTLVGCASGDTSKAQGTWGTANVTGEPWLILEADGSFNGSDGCNGVFGAGRGAICVEWSTVNKEPTHNPVTKITAPNR